MKYMSTHTPEVRWGAALPLPQRKCHVLSDGVSFLPAFEALPGPRAFTCLGCQVLPFPSLMQHCCPLNCTVLFPRLDCPGCDRARAPRRRSHMHSHWDACQAHASMHIHTQFRQTGAQVSAIILNTPTCAKHFSLSKEKRWQIKTKALLSRVLISHHFCSVVKNLLKDSWMHRWNYRRTVLSWKIQR